MGLVRQQGVAVAQVGAGSYNYLDLNWSGFRSCRASNL